MKQLPRISVIITTKNRKSFLAETIRSFLSQSLPPHEIIVVDDKSTDGTKEMLETEFAGKINHVINTRGGLSAGRNIGFENVTGDYIKVFDDDDVLSPNSLEVQYQTLKSTGKKFVFSPYIKAIFNNGWQPVDVLMHHLPLPSKMSVLKFMVKGGILVLPTCLFTKEIIDRAGPYNENITTYEDWDYLWKLAQIEPFPAHTNLSLMVYRQHGNQMTNGMLKQDLINKDKIAIFQKALLFMLQNRRDFGQLDIWYMKYRIFQTLSFISDKKYNQEVSKDKPLCYPLYSILYRMENKYQRLRSKSNWTTWHGTSQMPLSITERLLPR